MKRVLIILLSILVYQPSFTQETDSIIDPRDGQVYNIVKIGFHWWMAENLNATQYADGTPLVDGTGVGNIVSDYTLNFISGTMMTRPAMQKHTVHYILGQQL
jgi:hypothetical protein